MNTLSLRRAWLSHRTTVKEAAALAAIFALALAYYVGR